MKLTTTLDVATGLCTTPCLVIVRQTEDPAAPLRYHGFGGEGTATLYAAREDAEQVLGALNPAQGWRIQRVLMVARVAIEQTSA